MDDIENENPDEAGGDLESSPRKRVGSESRAAAPPNVKRKKTKVSTAVAVRDGGVIAAEVAGRIASIELENFMCHAHLKLTYDVHNKNCFYIGGPNGSGKSALFAAFNLGLGGRGSNNDRGNSVKGYIKQGKSRARIIITLTNRGEGAISGYGDYIVVERTITQSASTYKLKSKGGAVKEEVISSKKSDLDRILAKLKIDLANPVFWMSQDRSRQFLQDLDPSKMFNIFMKATDLERTEQEYHQTNANLADIAECEKLVKEDLAKKKERVDRAKELRKLAETSCALRTQLECVDWMLMWAPLRDVTTKLKSLEAKKKKHKDEMEILKYRHRVNCEDLKEKVKEMEELNEHLKDAREGNQYYLDNLTENKNEQKKLRLEESRLQDERKRLNADKRRAAAKVTQIEVQIEEAKARMANDESHRAMEKLKERIQQLKNEESDLIENRRLAEQEAEGAQQEMSEAERQAREASRRERELTAQLSDQRKLLERNEAMEKNQLARFGNNVPAILNVLKDHANQFEKPPKGPIGMHVRVRDAKWAFAIEEALRAILQAFLFNSKRDEDTFKRILTAKGINCRFIQTIVTRFDLPPHNISRSEVSREFETILRQLDFDDNAVRNCLIDMGGIESTLLIEKDDEARRLMDGQCPDRCRSGYTMSGSQVFGRNANGVGQYRFYKSHKQPTATMLGANTAGNKADIMAAIQRLQQEIPEVKREMAETQNEYKRLRSDHQSGEGKQRSIEMNLQRVRDTIRRSTRDLEKYEVQNDDDQIDNLRLAIEEHRKNVKEQEESVKKIEAELQKLAEKREELVQAQTEISEGYKEHQEENQPHEDALEGLRKKIDQQNANIQIQDQAMKDLDKNVPKFDAEWVELQKQKDDADRLAANTSQMDVPKNFTNPPDFSTLLPTAEAEQEKYRLEREFELCERRLNAMPETENYGTLAAEYAKAKKMYKAVRKHNAKLAESLSYRLEKFPLVKYLMIRKLEEMFQGLMTYCKFSGELKVNVTSKTLKVFVRRGAVQQKDRAAPVNEKIEDMKGLSGGERSYTSACLIMSLWGVMEAPFRLMDEFDVFMDMLNRKIIMDLLVNMATVKFPHHQFIFFTPQGIKELTDTDGVEIFELTKILPG